MLIDKFNRKVDYLRIGITDRCNLRCRYCMPEQGIDFSSRKELLTYEEILYLVRIFKDLGITKVRLTGGEPLSRKDVDVLIKNIYTHIPNIHITTNATHLEPFIPLFQEINLQGLNVSLDSLDRDKFTMITRRDAFDSVISNSLSAKKAGLPVKFNMVVMKGINDMEINDFIEFGMQNDIQVRFIEAMPFNAFDGNKDVFMDSKDILNTVMEKYSNVEAKYSNNPSSSVKYTINDSYKFGIIPAYSGTMCGTCNRIRLTPKGEVLTCLYSEKGINLKDVIRNKEHSEEEIISMVKNLVSNKLKSGWDEEKLRGDSVFNSMTSIGG